MTAIPLWDFQERLIAETRQAYRSNHRRILIVSPTGSGKTRTGAAFVQAAVDKGYRVWWVTHRRELVKQTTLVFAGFDIPVGIVSAGFPTNANAPVLVCSVQTLARRHVSMPQPHLIVFDECHHIASNTFSQIASAYPTAAHLGLTATPTRLDSAGLGKWFDTMILGPSVRELIDRGRLSEYRLFAPKPPDLHSVETLAGDYNKKQMVETMDRSSVAGDTLAHYQKHVNGKRAIVFMWSVESSIEMADRFNRAGIPTAHIDGGTDDRVRDRTVQQFRDGQILVLTNVEIFSEGYDCPAVDAGFFCRPTQSLTLYLQQVGRVLRPTPGKVAFLFDQAGNSRRLGMPCEDREWSLETTRKRRKRKDDREDAVRVCPQCTETWGMHVRVCRCGQVLVQSREMDVDEHAELTEVRADEIRRDRLREQSSARDKASLIAYGKKKGFKHPELWASHILRAREEKALRRATDRAMGQSVTIDENKTEDGWLF